MRIGARQKAVAYAEDLPVASGQTTTPGARRIQKTRRHLASVAVELFEKRGFASTTIEEISKAADYSISSFFRLFGDKEEVVFWDYDDRLQEVRAIYQTSQHDNVWLTIKNSFILKAGLLDKEGDGPLGNRRIRLIYSEPALHRRFLVKTAEWEEAIVDLLIIRLGNNPDGRLKSRLIAGSAIAAFRAAWLAQLEDKQPAMEKCVEIAFDKLEHLDRFAKSSDW